VLAVGGARQSLGYFTSEEEAAHAYDDKAKEVLGDDAILNFHPDGSPNFQVQSLSMYLLPSFLDYCYFYCYYYTHVVNDHSPI